jgi:hypothetical protein
MEWISVEDRNPGNQAKILVWDIKEQAIKYAQYRGGRFWISEYFDEDQPLHPADVSHWYPLPEPPKKAS